MNSDRENVFKQLVKTKLPQIPFAERSAIAGQGYSETKG